MKLDFSGRVALVTGAGNGLGAAYARWLASDRCDRSGIILSAGAGRVRRAYMVESALSPVSEEGEMYFGVLDELSGATETINSRWSCTTLIPELIKTG